MMLTSFDSVIVSGATTTVASRAVQAPLDAARERAG
jgi:hypothetical protein